MRNGRSDSIYRKCFSYVFFFLFLHQSSWTAPPPKMAKFDFFALSRGLPKRGQSTKADDIQYKVVKTLEEVDVRCFDGEDRSRWIRSSTSSVVFTPFRATSSIAGEYTCPAKTFYLVVTDVMQFYDKSQNMERGVVSLMKCQSFVFTGSRKFEIRLSIAGADGRIMARKTLYTLINLNFISVEASSSKELREAILPMSNFYTCFLEIFESEKMKKIYETSKKLTATLYKLINNVRPNTTKVSIGQAVQCLSSGLPPAHRYLWKPNFYNYTKRDPKKPLYLPEGNLLKIYHEGNHSFTCTAFNAINKKEYSMSWVGIIQVVSSSKLTGRRVEERSTSFETKLAVGGSFTTIVIIVAVVSYARR